ncbi:MAG TPA: phosphatidylserine decarboxylase [Crocinitomicaceae bacterium]|nr:phosphatidylserine decarboxylase [Crocinitomicaceae bacterium]
MQEIHYINRSNNQEEIEKVPGNGFLNFLYGGNPLGKMSLWLMVKRKYFSVVFGKYMRSSFSKSKIAPFVKKHQIDLNDYQKQEFEHFNDFFYRKIKPSARPIGDGIVSPADGRVLVFPKISDTQQFYVKGSAFDLITFLQNEELAKKYDNGSMMVVRLAPVDYHRFHFPVSGVPSENKKIKGDYYSVSPIALREKVEIFLQNKREYCVLHNKEIGDVLICDVGATLTAGIHQTYQPTKPFQKGDEKGYFSFGGSTLIVLFEEGKMNFSKDLIENTSKGFETLLKMGEQISE